MSRVRVDENLGARGYVGRAGRSPGQLWQVPIFLLGLLTFSAVAVTAPSRQDQTSYLFETELAALRQGLEPDHEKPAILVAKAENLLARIGQFPRKAGEIHFLTGSAYFRQASLCTPDAVEANRKKVRHHLEEALLIGVGPGDFLPLQYRLGVTLFQQGKELKRALELMSQSVDKGADRPALGYGLLVKAYLSQPKPNLEAALLASQKQLELTDDRNVEEMALARLTRAELLLEREQRQEALKELERISPNAPRGTRLKARLLQTRLCAEEGLWNRAIPLWKELLKDADNAPGGKANVLYSLGQAYLNADPAKLDEAAEHWRQALALGGEDGQAAGLRLGELLVFGPTKDVKGALEIWTKVLEKVNTPNEYQNKTLELSQVRAIFENACRHFVETQDFEQIRQIADLYKRFAAPGIAEERVAQAAEGIAKELKEQVQQLAAPEAKAKMEEARTHYHRAGVAYEQAAIARADEAPADIYWRSAYCYLAAKDFSRATSVLDKFVQLDNKDEARLAEAWLSLAEAYLALGHKDKAVQAYYKCIEYPQTPFAYRARYKLALDEIEKKSYDQAREILQQNLTSTGPMMDRTAHEKSIYKMADLSYLMQDFDKAALYFKEAARQYPANADVLVARDQLADCYDKLAKLAQRKAQTAREEEAKAHHLRTRQNWLEQGAVTYQTLADELEAKAREGALAPGELVLLRKALFGTAELRFEMNEFSEALRRYQTLQEKYRKQVEGLIACQRIWRCVGVMVDTPEQAKLVRNATLAAVKMAQADLDTMPEDSEAFRGGMGVWTKSHWQQWLNWVRERLNPAAEPARPSVIN